MILQQGQGVVVSNSIGLITCLGEDNTVVSPDIVATNNTFSFMQEAHVFISQMFGEGHFWLGGIFQLTLGTINNIAHSTIVKTNNNYVTTRLSGSQRMRMINMIRSYWFASTGQKGVDLFSNPLTKLCGLGRVLNTQGRWQVRG